MISSALICVRSSTTNVLVSRKYRSRRTRTKKMVFIRVPMSRKYRCRRTGTKKMVFIRVLTSRT